jgi:hypothetical protein
MSPDSNPIFPPNLRKEGPVSNSRVTCPECAAQLALGPTVAPGKRIRCPRCETVFAVPESEPPAVADRSRPARRRFKPKKQGTSAGVITAAVIAGLLLVGGAATGVYHVLKAPNPAAVAQKGTAPAAGVGVNVGQPAREIEGQDVDGVPFKLSDYRGKVVLLDFWGHW